MTNPWQGPAEPPPARRSFSPGRLWAAGAGTAVVVALVVVVGVIVIRLFVKSDLLAPVDSGSYGDGSTTSYALAAAGAALAATALLHVLLLAMPSPLRFFSWIVGLLTAAATLLPFTFGGSFGHMLAVAAINLVVGLAILTILPSSL
ncbi:DUF6069 family protein [Actinocorallia longicatena]|uniref:Integral membrane protein n=1 Tax=Actinocorallia longicatena TaxID=111803 RepID=A0ABP6QHB6_9ACTN